MPLLQSGRPLAVLLLVAGCATTSPQAAFEAVEAGLEERGVERVHWHTGVEADEEVAETVRRLLDEELTVESAVQVTLLNNRRLQAVYSELGVAQADLVDAGLLSNPLFSGSILFPVNSRNREINLGITQSFLDIFFVPLRRRVAESLLDETKLIVTASVLDFEYRARNAFYHAQASSQRVEMFEQITLATELGYELARRLHEAGNITQLELNEHRDLYEQARVELRLVERDHRRSRENLNRIMGVSGGDVEWNLETRLPPPPDDELDLDDIETQVIEASLDLEIARQRIMTAGRLLGVREATALVPSLTVGAEAEHEAGSWIVGPTLALPIPFFDRGQARIARSRSELRMQQDSYQALGVEIDSRVRAAREDLKAAREIATHYQDTILPLRERITEEAQLHYNAMQIGLFGLLRARERQIEAGERYVEALLRYWTARTVIEQLLKGRTPHPVPEGVLSGDGSF